MVAIPTAIFAVTFIILFIIRKILISLFIRFTSKTATKLDDIIILAFKKPSVLWVVAISLHIAISFSKIPHNYVLILTKTIIIIIIISVTVALSNLVGNIFRRYLKESSVPVPTSGLFNAILKSTIYVIGFLIVLNYLGISIAPIITALGVGGLAVALALRDTLANLFSGIHIMVEKAIKIGDYVKLESGLEGYVEDVTWRTTRIKTLQNNIIIIPNEKLVQAIVTNYDLQDKKVAVTIQVGVSYNSDIEKVEAILLEIGKNVISNFKEAAGDEPVVRFNPGFTDSALVFTLILYAKEFSNQYKIQSEVRKAIFKRFKAENIEIPFPQMDVHIKDNHQ